MSNTLRAGDRMGMHATAISRPHDTEAILAERFLSNHGRQHHEPEDLFEFTQLRGNQRLTRSAFRQLSLSCYKRSQVHKVKGTPICLRALMEN
jgi:hypothetical protein